MYLDSRDLTGFEWFAFVFVNVDDDGDLFVTGRVDDMIITGGENVSPVEIESCLSLHGAVSEVAVAGLPDGQQAALLAALPALENLAEDLRDTVRRGRGRLRDSPRPD